MVDLKIYDAQHGTMIYPRRENIINEKIKIFFNKKIRLCIEKTSDNQIIILCNINAYEKMGRVEGYYVKYKDIYTQDSLGSFKKETEKILSELELHLKNISPIDNIIFNNIEKFDTNKFEDIKTSEDISNVLEVLSSGKKLMYKAGKIDEIVTFCRDILKKSDIIRMVISANENKSNDADIDIFVDKKYEERLNPTKETEKILKDVLYKKIKEEKEKRLEEERKKQERKKVEQEKARELKDEITKEETNNEVANEKQPKHRSKRKHEFKRYQEEKESWLKLIDKIIIVIIIILILLLMSMVLFETKDNVRDSGPESSPVPTIDSTLIPVQSYSSKTYINNDLNGIAFRIAIPTP